MVKLLPCPFCNYSPLSAWVSSSGLESDDCGYWQITCSRCGLATATGDDEEDAARHWNTRPDSLIPGPWLDKYTLPQLMHDGILDELHAEAMALPTRQYELRDLMVKARDVIELNQRRIRELKGDIEERDEWHRKRMERHQEAAVQLYAKIHEVVAQAHEYWEVPMTERRDPLGQVHALAGLLRFLPPRERRKANRINESGVLDERFDDSR